MAILSAVLTDINLRYRNTFTQDQVLVWLNEERRELYQMFDIESTPYSITTVADTQFYTIPSGVDMEQIKVMTLQIDDATNPSFVELPFIYNDNRSSVPYGPWCTVEGNALFVSIPGGVVADRAIYIYCDQTAIDLTTSDLSSEPISLKYQEVLKLGTLKRIAQARKDGVMANNYDAEREQKIGDLLIMQQLNAPEFVTPADMLPRRNRLSRTGRNVEYVTLKPVADNTWNNVAFSPWNAL